MSGTRNLKPVTFDLQLGYNCSSCESIYWLTKEEVKLSIPFVCCGIKHTVQPYDNLCVTNRSKKIPDLGPFDRKEVEKVWKKLVDRYTNENDLKLAVLKELTSQD
jgi:hypothetical protein